MRDWLRENTVLLLSASFVLSVLLHFFETFPNGWDQAEYVWCVKAGYLPHSPYLLFIGLGRLIAAVLPDTAPPALALSLLSLGAGLASIVLLARLVLGAGYVPLVPSRVIPLWPVWAGLLLGLSSVFVRQATTQEVYSLQLAVLLGAALALVPGRADAGGGGGRNTSVIRSWVAGALFGAALCIHYASVFVAPALLLLLIAPLSADRRLPSLGCWLGGAGLVAVIVYGWAALVLPASSEPRLIVLLDYLRGLRPELSFGSLLEPGFLVDSARAFYDRLTSPEIELTRGPIATGPVGASLPLLLVAAAGLIVSARRAKLAAAFWGLWLLPFLAYELVLGWNLDYGIYLVFVMPPLCALCAHAGQALSDAMPGVRGRVLVLALVLGLMVPSGLQLYRAWGDPARDRRQHDSVATLAAAWAADALPPDAVIIQPRASWNSNLLPLYSERQHVARSGNRLRVLRSTERYTPMKPDSYELLSTAHLRGWLSAGRPVYAFEPNPIHGANPGTLDAHAFRWDPVGAVDLARGAMRLGAPVPKQTLALSVYRAAPNSLENGAVNP